MIFGGAAVFCVVNGLLSTFIEHVVLEESLLGLLVVVVELDTQVDYSLSTK